MTHRTEWHDRPARRSRSRWLSLMMVVSLLLAACSGQVEVPPGLTVVDGFDVQLWAQDFNGPTQMDLTGDGDMIIAELNGAENDATGQILSISTDDPTERVVLQTGLDKPTGLAVAGDLLWIMERQKLSVTTLVPGASRQVVAEDLPFNGRSQGTLTVTADDRLLYNTSGSKRGPDRVAGSGTLFAIADASTGPSEPTVVATGFKHAYAHVQDPDGQLWSVEMTDGNFDGARASDELLAVDIGDDAGWPQCVDDNRPVTEFGGTAESCSALPRSHALLGQGATPTSLVVAPWDNELFIITLWLPGEVVTVPRQPGPQPYEPTVFIDGIESPQHVLVMGSTVLISDHETGQIYSVIPS